MSAPHLNHLAQLIGNDSHAATFQSLVQYRSALLKEIAQATAAPEQEAVAYSYRQLMHDSMGGWESKITKHDPRKSQFIKPEDIQDIEPLYTHPSAEIERLRAENKRLAAAVEYNKAPDDAEFGPGHPVFEMADETDKANARAALAERRLADAQALLQRTHRDLDACQKVIWLAGVGSRGYGFDPAYCDDAQARLAEIDAFLSAAQQGDQP